MAADANSKGMAMNGVLHAGERNRLRAGLEALPDTVPPRAVWRRIERQARAEGLLGVPAWVLKSKWLVGAGIAAAVVVAVLRFPGVSGLDGAGPDDSGASYHTPPYTEQSAWANAGAVTALMKRSQELEQDLRAITYQPTLVRASTAATISSLEDRIAAIDYQLNHPAVRLSPAEVELYWRERVRLMDSLVTLRYAQAQRASF